MIILLLYLSVENLLRKNVNQSIPIMERRTKQTPVKYQKITCTGLIIWVLTITTAYAQTRIEGISYLDNKPIAVMIDHGRIVSVQPIDRLTGSADPVYIAPGLIDNQVNGFAGVSFGFGGSELTGAGILKATQELWKKGVTTYLPTLTTNSRDLLIKNLKILAGSKNDPALQGSIAGYHLEGPYISPDDGYRGAHPAKYVRQPDWQEFMELYEASGRNILTVTLAPETGGAIGFIRQCTEEGIIVAIGHHNASKDIIDEAVEAGARIATHLGNGCANLINRHLNPLWPQLANDRLMVSLICDGFHLRDEEISVFYKVKGPDKTIITSDVTGFAAMPPGLYKNEDDETIELTPEGMLRYPSQNVLYGSASAISRGVVHVMAATGCSLGDAVRMASTNPAKLYGLTDRGSIEPGKRADLILFEMGSSDLSIKKTYVNGELVYDSSR
jgi:N-acetylglucosamine-6-phosphate deacetylase